MDMDNRWEKTVHSIEVGGPDKYHHANEKKGKMFVRERLKKLFDDGIWKEDGKFANCQTEGLPADGVVTAIGKVGEKTVCVMANDSTVKAGSW
ncbi:carboxyl transferase domain-containing protein, partial [Pseudomonas sp. 2822-15]|uniref:carboxyl transferase domain-containing protein n=1 Tax=Pseudomonas sp. 2822-15 TaxID=1712677 RepID=UPI00273A6DFB